MYVHGVRGVKGAWCLFMGGGLRGRGVCTWGGGGGLCTNLKAPSYIDFSLCYLYIYFLHAHSK